MMKIRLQLILAASVVYFGLTLVQLHNQVADQAVISEMRIHDRSKIRKHFRNIFNSMAKNDKTKSEIYGEFLKEGARREQSAFDTMNKELRIGQSRKVHHKSNVYPYKKIDVGVKNILTVKRETKKDDFNADTEGQYMTSTASTNEDREVRLQKMDAVARKLRAFETWEVSMFGNVLKVNQRTPLMRMFLKKLVKDDDWALEMAEKFRSVWGILPTSDPDLASKVAREYSDEISSLGSCVYKWCEYQIIEVAAKNTKYLDLAVNAGVVSIAELKKDAICMGYAKWKEALNSAFTTQSTSRMRTLYFYPEATTEEALTTSTVEESTTDSTKKTTAKKKKTTTRGEDADYYMDSGEDLSFDEDSTDSGVGFTKNKSLLRLPNWH